VAVDLREAYVSYAAGPLDLRAGRLVETWGVGDLVFINDLFPKDWDAFFSGRSLEYLKLGVDAFEARLSAGRYAVTVVAIPTFTPDRLPGERFDVGHPPLRTVDSPPAPSASSAQLAARLSGQLGPLDLALYAQRGFWRTPSLVIDPTVSPPRAVALYPALSTFGASLQANAGGGTLSAEAGYYDSRDDREGVDPAIPDSQGRALVGYQLPLAGELAAGAQVYLEQSLAHAARPGALPGAVAERERRWLVTARIHDLFWYQSVRATLFAAWSPTDRDLLVAPELDWRPLDDLGLTVGANLLGGRASGYFGRLARDSLVYLRVRFDF
jgi:hypothetical protein